MGVDIQTPGSGTFVRLVRQTLTDKTTFSGTSAEQWGTEEATFDDGLLPALTNVTVYAHVAGYILNPTQTSNLTIDVQISLDGGSTWTGRTPAGIIFRHSAVSNAFDKAPVFADCQVTGTVTGDIQARAMVTSVTGSGDVRDLSVGAIQMQVLA